MRQSLQVKRGFGCVRSLEAFIIYIYMVGNGVKLQCVCVCVYTAVSVKGNGSPPSTDTL